MIQNVEMPKFPYLSSSTKLIDFFMIIGFEDTQIQQDIVQKFNDSEETKSRKSNRTPSVSSSSHSYKDYSTSETQERPVILNNLVSINNKRSMDEEVLINIIFPTKIILYYQYNKLATLNLPKISQINVLNGDDYQKSNAKTTFNIFSYIFYEKVEFDDYILNIPKAICIVSQYPYFSFYKHIAELVHSRFEGFETIPMSVPLEIFILNLLNFLPSPLNSSVKLDLFGEEEERRRSIDFTQSRSSVSGSASLRFSMPNIGLGGLNSLNNGIPRSQALNNPNDKHESVNIKIFKQLSGYPNVDIVLTELLKIFEINQIIEIFLFTLLEIDTLFFSSNIEHLNAIMYIFSILSFPCHDTIYSWHIVTVSTEELSKVSRNSAFVGKPTPNMIGIKYSYDDKVNTYAMFGDHYIVDIDHSQCILKIKQHGKKQSSKNLYDIYTYIQDKLAKREFDTLSVPLLITRLIVRLEEIKKKIDMNEQIDFFNYNSHHEKNNQSFQLAFFAFMLDFMNIVYSSATLQKDKSLDGKEFYSKDESQQILQKSKNFGKICSKIGETNVNFEPGEILIFKTFSDSCRFLNYFCNFLEFAQSVDVYEIPLIFSENFLQILSFNQKLSALIDYLALMDSFYYSKINKIYYPQTSHMITFLTPEKLHSINFKQVNEYFINIARPLYNNINKKLIEVSVVGKEKEIIFKYRRMELDQKLISEYIYLLISLGVNELDNLFPFYKYTREINIQYITLFDIIDSIEAFLINNKRIEGTDLIKFSAILAMLYFNEQCYKEKYVKTLLKFFEESTIFMIKFLTISVCLFFKIAEKKVNQGITADVEIELINTMFNFLIKKDISPNFQVKNVVTKYPNLIELNEKLKGKGESVPDVSNVRKSIKPNFKETQKIGDYELTFKADKNFDKNTIKSTAFLKSNYYADVSKGNSRIMTLKNRVTKKRNVFTLYTPLKMYAEMGNILNKYYTNSLEIEDINSKKFQEILMNIIFYIKLLSSDEKNNPNQELFTAYTDFMELIFPYIDVSSID